MTPLADALATPMTAPDPAVQQAIALAFLDTFACIRAGWAEPAVTRLAQSQEAQTTATQAALWATAAHALDWDDYEAFGSTHPSAVLVPVILSLGAEATQARAVAAYAAGYRTISTLGHLIGYGHYRAGWHATSTLGTLGATSAAATLLNASPAQHAAALRIGTSRAGGLKGQFGGLVKPLHAGFAAQNGIEAARLAMAGIAPPPGVLTGTDGFLDVFGPPENRWAQSRSVQTFADNPVFAKPWPSCAYSHRAVEAALRLGPIPADKIDALALKIPAPYAKVAGYRAPQNPDEARFSVTYCMAAALINGEFSPTSVADETRNRPDLVKAEAMVQLDTYDLPKGVGDMAAAAPDTLTVTLTSGKVLQETVANAKGGPAKPLLATDIIQKFAQTGGDAHAAQAFLNAHPDAPFDTTLVPKPSLP